jgi:hypothetical protein
VSRSHSLLWAHSFARRRVGRFSNRSRLPRSPLLFGDVLDANLVFLGLYLLFSYRCVSSHFPYSDLLPFLREKTSVHTPNTFFIEQHTPRDESVWFPNFGSLVRPSYGRVNLNPARETGVSTQGLTRGVSDILGTRSLHRVHQLAQEIGRYPGKILD